ncbi:MAG: prolipoprotein diacylglyceryl transferase [Spirochaetaceae bacterium]|jgi:phosphatidylglycerol:prolipoprotein diacylglycerol transferase|nr:prolipoprotein diacylglyceryl transferase [Spirochaetaceae bacterium]
MLLAIDFPSWLKPEVIPGLPLRWYGLMYIVAFTIAYRLCKRQIRERRFPMQEDDLFRLFIFGVTGLILGARILSTLVYESDPFYRENPWFIFWPFRDGQFTGFMGMSYHGGVLGCVLGVILFCIVKHFDFREIADMVCAAIPLGYTFGRLGNFINGELYGRVTPGPLGMIFPQAQPFSARLDWVRELAEKTGVPVPGPSAMINLPRHPSQLYEAFFEGIVLFCIVWALRNRKPFKGFITGLYFAGYGFIRFFLEYLRAPDANLGYRITLADNGVPPALFSTFFNFTTGQVFCFVMIICALIWWIIASRLPGAEAPRFYPDAEQIRREAEEARAREATREQQRRRRLRKRLR